MHHGVQQLDWGIKVVVLAVLTAQVRNAHLQVQWGLGTVPPAAWIRQEEHMGGWVGGWVGGVGGWNGWDE